MNARDAIRTGDITVAVGIWRSMPVPRRVMRMPDQNYVVVEADTGLGMPPGATKETGKGTGWSVRSVVRQSGG